MGLTPITFPIPNDNVTFEAVRISGWRCRMERGREGKREDKVVCYDMEGGGEEEKERREIEGKRWREGWMNGG